MTVEQFNDIIQYLQYIQDLLTMILTFIIGYFAFKSISIFYKFVSWMFR